MNPFWKPIETAPKDNKCLLLLAEFHDNELVAVDFDGTWESDRESWEMPERYWFWQTACGTVEEPTHWAWQPEDFNRMPVESTP